MNRGHVHREVVDGRSAGRPLLAHLRERGGPLGEAEWRERILAGAVRIDGAVADPGAILRAGQHLTWERPPWEEPPAPLCAAVLHEDPDLLAVAKPRGLPTLPGGGEFQDHTLLAVVRRRDPLAVPMHRLGRHTSGIVLFARTAPARSAVQAQLRERRVGKTYRALCAGHPSWDDLLIEAPIGEVPHAPTGTVHAARDGGRPSRSRARVLERREGSAPTTLVEVEIATGRPHQIRIHLAWAGHPLAGDPLYGEGGVPRPGSGAVPGDPGYLLHALRLELVHFRDGRPLRLECPAPPALRPGRGTTIPTPLTNPETP